MFYYTVNVNSTKAKLFDIRYSINQATNSIGICKITVVTDSIYTIKKIFESLLYLFQIHLAAILQELYKFFLTYQKNLIEFWECPSCCNWSLYKVVDNKSKSFNSILLYSCKSSWDYSKNKECNNLSNNWKMVFQALYLKGIYFLDLYNSDNNIIKLLYAKDSVWLKFFSYSNSLCVRATRVIMNHVPIGEY